MPEIVRNIFEDYVKERFDLQDCIAVNNGTSALIAPLWSMDLQPEDEIITTPFTFISTSNSIIISGGKPVFVDIDPKTYLIDTEKIEENDPDEMAKLEEVAGIVVPGGFGNRGIEGKIKVAQYCRENRKPYLGLCLGSQIMAIEFARNVLGIDDATSEEFDEEGKSKNHVIHFIPDQREIRKKGGTMRLGAYPAFLKKGTNAFDIYGQEEISERHRHRFEFNNEYREAFEARGFKISGISPDDELVEVVEIEGHPFMVASQFHPELKSRPLRPHPLFRDFLGASVPK